MPSNHPEQVLDAGDGNDVGESDPLQAPFETSSIAELPAWADSLGRWLYV